jgi:hypothetical protein
VPFVGLSVANWLPRVRGMDSVKSEIFGTLLCVTLLKAFSTVSFSRGYLMAVSNETLESGMLIRYGERMWIC